MESFPSLLGELDAGSNEESFWPSFTDIMMVVVMIFLISTTLLIVRNVELVRSLTETTAAEKEAQQASQATLAENLTLEERVAAMEELLSTARLEQMRTQEEKESLATRVDELINKLGESTRTQESIEAKLAARMTEIQAMSDKLSQLDSEMSQAQKELTLKSNELTNKQGELASATSTIESMRTNQQQQAKSFNAIKLQAGVTEESLTALQQEYAKLQSQYDKLIRPARTTKGKHVVSVRVIKESGSKRYEIKNASENTYTQTSKANLHAQLLRLKNKHQNKLYIRIVIPDNSNLTYQEAYGFTNEILNQYDYYRQ
jgi:biopolymer transport protein ExbD